MHSGPLVPGQFARLRMGPAETAIRRSSINERAVGTDQSVKFRAASSAPKTSVSEWSNSVRWSMACASCAKA